MKLLLYSPAFKEELSENREETTIETNRTGAEETETANTDFRTSEQTKEDKQETTHQIPLRRSARLTKKESAISELIRQESKDFGCRGINGQDGHSCSSIGSLCVGWCCPECFQYL